MFSHYNKLIIKSKIYFEYKIAFFLLIKFLSKNNISFKFVYLQSLDMLKLSQEALSISNLVLSHTGIFLSIYLSIYPSTYPFLYRVVQIKVYHQLCSLNQLINWFFMQYSFFSIYTDNSLFVDMFLKLIGKI